MSSVNDAPQIYVEYALPVLGRSEHGAARLDTGVVHQDVCPAEPVTYCLIQVTNVVDTADIGLQGHDTRRTPWCRLGKERRRSSKPVAPEGLSSFKPGQGAHEVKAGEEVSRRFWVACCDAPKVFDCIEEAFDEIALGIEREVAFALNLAV